MVVGAGRGAIHADLPDHLAYGIRAGLRVRQHPVPGAVASPAIEAIRTRLPRSVALGQVAPGRAGAQFPQDAVDHGTVIPPLAATLTTRWEQGSDDAPRFLGQFPTSHHVAAPRSVLTWNESSTSQVIRQTAPSPP